MAKAGQKGVGHYIALGVIVIAVLVYLIPIYWIVVTSLKSPGDLATKVPKFIFRITFENYRKLMPQDIPAISYLFLAQGVIGLLLSLFPHRLDRLSLVWNGLFGLTCLYAVVTTRNFNFLLFALYALGVYWVIAKTTTPPRQIRYAFINAGIFAIVVLALTFAHAGSKYFHQLLNSIIIGVSSTILAVGLGTISAYAFSRFRIAGKEDLLFFILSTRMLPPIVVVIPIYLMYSAIGLRDTHFGLILLYTTFNVSFAVWLMKGFIDEIPKEYEDAALVDGYTRFQTFLKVVLPQSVTGIAATAVFCLITAWNEFAFALVLTEVGGKAVTAPPSIPSATGSGGIEWAKIAASTFVFLLPVAIFTFLMRGHLLRGVTFGAVKK